MREPPKMTQPHTGESMPAVVSRFIRELNDVTAWIAESVAPTTQPERTELQWCHSCQGNVEAGDEHFRSLTNRAIALSGHAMNRRCPDCTTDSPCERVREFMGQT